MHHADAIRKAQGVLDMMGLGDRGAAKVDQLSGGQQQRLMIARALIHDPEVLFLDEPTVGLDPQARLDLWEMLRQLHGEGRTIVMTTHYMEEADQLCERIAIVDRGRLLACDSPRSLKAQAPGGTRDRADPRRRCSGRRGAGPRPGRRAACGCPGPRPRAPTPSVPVKCSPR